MIPSIFSKFMQLFIDIAISIVYNTDMFNNSIQRIGFCCKYMDPDQSQKPKVLKEIQQNFTEKGTTVAWCNRQEKSIAEQKLLDVVTHNMQSAYNHVE